MRKLIYILIPLLLLVACDNQSATGNEDSSTTEEKHPAAQIVEDYLQARVDTDEEGLRATLCPAQESQIPLQLNSFRGRNASLDNVVCEFDDDTTVTCSGNIVTVYEGETTERPAGNFSVIQDDGEWKVCGEA